MYELERQVRLGKNLGNGLIKADHFLTHRVDVALMLDCGREFAKLFADAHATMVLTAETSGIAPAMATAIFLKVPLVFARKHKPMTMGSEVYHVTVDSHTHGNTIDLTVSSEFLTYQDRVIIIDDFLASGKTIGALASIVAMAKAKLLGVGAVVEKSFEFVRDTLEMLDIPVYSLITIAGLGADGIFIKNSN